MEILEDKTVVGMLFRNDFVEVRYEEAYSLVVIQWKRQITLNERQIGYKTAFEYIKGHQATSLLVNNEKIFLFTPQEKLWLSGALNNWISETKIQKLALVTSDLYKNLTDLAEFIEEVKDMY